MIFPFYRDSTLEEHSQLAKIPTLVREKILELRKVANYLSCIEGKRGGKDIH